jgi:hypothetical protein
MGLLIPYRKKLTKATAILVDSVDNAGAHLAALGIVGNLERIDIGSNQPFQESISGAVMTKGEAANPNQYIVCVT